MPAQEFKSVMRTFQVGEPYTSCADLLSAEGADGWQLVGVTVLRGKLEHEVGEVFYLTRQKTGP